MAPKWRAVLLAAACMLSVPALAWAHGALKSSTPMAGAHLAVVPSEIRLDFNESPELPFVRIQLSDAAGRDVRLDAPGFAAGSRRTVVARVRGIIEAGVYTVRWQMAGTDGHPVRDTLVFVVAPGAAGTGAAQVEGDTAAAHNAAMAEQAHQDPVTMPTGAGFDSESFLYVLIRWSMFMGLLVVVGATAFRQLVLRFLSSKQSPDSPVLDRAAANAARYGYWATGALLVVALLRLLAQSAAMHGTGEILNPALVATLITKTLWGRGWLLQVAALVSAGFGFHRALRAPALSHAGRTGWSIATLGVVILAFTPALAGHASAAPLLPSLSILSDGLHVLGAGGWMGGLLMVLAAGLPAALSLPEGERGAMVAELFNAFSPTALMFAGVVAATGVFAAWVHVGTIPALWQTGYGRTLLLKLGLLSGVALTGAYNWLRVKPTLEQIEAADRIRRTAAVEIVIGILVLLVTAILVATPTSMEMDM